MTWLRESLATSPDYFFPNPGSDGAGPLVCPFLAVAQRVNCDDGDPCTEDICVDGRCYHDRICGN